MNLCLESMAVDFPRLASHPNRAPFRGVLTLVDTPSDRAPSGAGGHRVLLAREAVERALPSLLGMGLDYAPLLDRHDAQRKVGIITEADVAPASSRLLRGHPGHAAAARMAAETAGEPPALHISGFLYARDFPQLMRELRAQDPAEGGRGTSIGRGRGTPLGMSYEIADARVEDMAAAIWRVVDFTFTGAAILRRDKAAYRDTWIELI